MNATDPEAFQGLDEKYERLPIVQIVASRTNPRTHFPEDYLAQLALSLKEKGLIEPIIVRPLAHMKPKHGEGEFFEIVAGECRFRAGKQAGLTHLPSIIRGYTDEQVLELQLIENLHRKDLTPLEQARGYRRLIDTNPDKHSAETIATRIGMSPAWVWDRMKLNDLVPEAKVILEQERMTVGHAILIARLKPEDQQRVITFDDDASTQYRGVGLWRNDSGFDFDEDDPANKGKKKPGKYDSLKPCSVRELESWIRDHIRFDVEHAAKAQPMVFEETAAMVASAEATPGRGKKVLAITHEYRVADDARDGEERTYGSQSWERADGEFTSQTREHSVLGLVVAGRDQGDSFHVCVARDKCRVHFGAVIRQKEKNAKLRESGKGKQAAKLEKKAEDRKERRHKEEQQREEEDQRAWKASIVEFDEVALTSVKALPISKVIDRVIHRSEMNRALTAVCGKRQPRTADEALRVLALDAVVSRLSNAWAYDRANSTKAMRGLDIDVAAILKKHQPKKDASPAKKKSMAEAAHTSGAKKA